MDIHQGKENEGGKSKVEIWEIRQRRAEIGQHNKQGSMENSDRQSYQRSKMTGQARDEKEEGAFGG